MHSPTCISTDYTHCEFNACRVGVHPLGGNAQHLLELVLEGRDWSVKSKHAVASVYPAF